MKAPQHIDFQWTTRGLYHAVFCILMVVLFVLLLVMGCIAYEKGWSVTVAGFIEMYGFSLPGACLLFYLLDRFAGDEKTIYLSNDVLCFATQKRGVIYEFPVQQIKGLKIWYVFQGIYLLTVQLPEGRYVSNYVGSGYGTYGSWTGISDRSGTITAFLHKIR